MLGTTLTWYCVTYSSWFICSCNTDSLYLHLFLKKTTLGIGRYWVAGILHIYLKQAQAHSDHPRNHTKCYSMWGLNWQYSAREDVISLTLEPMADTCTQFKKKIVHTSIHYLAYVAKPVYRCLLNTLDSGKRYFCTTCTIVHGKHNVAKTL